MPTCRTRPSTSPMGICPSTSGPRSLLAATSRQPSQRPSVAMSTSRKAASRASTRSTVRVGPGRGRKVRFTGVLLGEWANTSPSYTTFRVYRGRSGKFVLHIERGPGWTMVNAEGKPAGWRGHLGIGDVSYGSFPGESTLEVLGSLEELRDRIPQQLFDMVAGSAQQPAVEDLDI